MLINRFYWNIIIQNNVFGIKYIVSQISQNVNKEH